MQIIRYQSVQVPVQLSAAGKVIFPDVQNLRGSRIQKINIIPGEVAQFALQGGQANPCTSSDLDNMSITLVQGSDEVVKDAPANMFNPYIQNSGTGVFNPDELKNLSIDWNKCYATFYAAPGNNPTYINIGVWYYYPTN